MRSRRDALARLEFHILRGQFYSFHCASWNRRSTRGGVTRVAAGRTLATMKFGHRFQQAIEATHPSVSDQVRPRALDDPPAAPSARVCPQTEGLSCQRAARQGRRRRLPPRSRLPPRMSPSSARRALASRGVDASEARFRAPRGPPLPASKPHSSSSLPLTRRPNPSSRRSSSATRR